MMNLKTSKQIEGILLINKQKGRTSFSLISQLRKRLGIKKIGHAGTLDPFATGVMVLLIGREYTKKAQQFLTEDKEYLAEVHLGVSTTTYDVDGEVTATSERKPSLQELKAALKQFQGEIEQIPPMFSAKKYQGKKLYELARKGKHVTRHPIKVRVITELLTHNFPFVSLKIQCSKGTYVRSIAHDLGEILGTGAHLSKLQRTRSGNFHIKDCLDSELISSPNINIEALLLK